MNTTIFDKKLIQRYDVAGPRYTSYPTAIQFSESYGENDFLDRIEESNSDPIPAPISLYFHIPFCDSICYYCGCSKIVSRDADKAEHYVELLKKEIILQGSHFAEDRLVTQMHWGGGTPTYLADDVIGEILDIARSSFSFADDEEGEFNIEVDPRTVDAKRIASLRSLGFNRISFGVQDFDPQVQEAVHRVQDTEQIRDIVEAARDSGFQSINLDLMYGLPHQNIESFSETLDTTIDISPDRLAVYNYAHLPELFKPQRRINEENLPTPDQKLDILQLTIDKLQSAGYVYIGMDHFAKAEDSLVKAQEDGTLHRNFQGYSTHANCDIVAMGVTAISSVCNGYAQNVKTIEEYEQCLNSNKLPVYRGIDLEPDDQLRRLIINRLLCHFRLEFKPLEEKWDFDFNSYFKTAIDRLKQMEKDGLVVVTEDSITITPSGRLLARIVCMEFDRYLQEKNTVKSFSRVI